MLQFILVSSLVHQWKPIIRSTHYGSMASLLVLQFLPAWGAFQLNHYAAKSHGRKWSLTCVAYSWIHLFLLLIHLFLLLINLFPPTAMMLPFYPAWSLWYLALLVFLQHCNSSNEEPIWQDLTLKETSFTYAYSLLNCWIFHAHIIANCFCILEW